jgi:hypothetical protein
MIATLMGLWNGRVMNYQNTILSAVLTTLIIAGPLMNAGQPQALIAEAQALQLRVSAAERMQFQNHFFGPQIVQVVIDDPGATDPDESTVGLQVKGTTVPRVHLSDGLWYHFFAEADAFGLFMDVMTDGVRDNRIAVTSQGPADILHPSLITIGTTSYTIVFDGAIGDSFVREITSLSGTGTVFVEVDEEPIFPTLPKPFLGAAPVLNPDVELGDGGDGTDGCAVQRIQNANTCDWPYIRLTEIVELDIVTVRAGSASVDLIYDDFSESVSSAIDRDTAYPVNAEIIVSYTDFMWNINPVDEDLISFVLDKNTGNPTNVIYRLARSHKPSFSTDLLPVLFRPNLNFDTRQILEVDSEGLSSITFYEQFDSATGQITPVIGGMRIAENARAVSSPEFASANIVPVITMIESDPNTSFFESIDEQLGGRSGIFAGVNDRVANFDYFDTINSAAMRFHDGFASVDKEFYDSADRAVFTVEDGDQNLRSRVSEQPPARESRSFVKVGNPFPLDNNPVLSNLFPTSDLNMHTLKNVSPPVGSTFDIDSIEVGSFFLIDDVATDLTANPDIRSVINFDSGDAPATRNGVAAAINDFFLNANDTVSTSPSDTQLAALQFNNPDLMPDGAFDKASGIIINTAIRLQDLNSFERFTLTKGQILRDSTAPSGSTPGATQAFDIDPFLSAVSIYRTTSTPPTTVTDLTSLSGNPLLDVFFPRYNLLQVDLAGLNVGVEDETGDTLKMVSVQVEAFRDLNLNGKLDSIAELNTARRTMVDFNPFQSADTDGDGLRELVNLGVTRIGIGSIRVVDLMNFDWDGDGKTILDEDLDDLGTTNEGQILLRVTVVLVGNDLPAEPVAVLDVGTQLAVIDFSGIGATVLQDQSEPSEIDKISLNAFENLLYRIQVKEQGSNSSVFIGRMDFMTANQFDTTEMVLGDIVLQGDPARAWLPNRFIPPDRLAFSYADINIVESFRIVSSTFIYESADGKMYWDRDWYRPQKRALLTLEDEDLNRKPDAMERYDLPVAGFVFLELGKNRVDDSCEETDSVCFFFHVDRSLMETGPDTGIFQAQIDMPPRLRLANGTIVNTNKDDLEITYIDVRDRSSVRQEFDDTTAVRTGIGKVILDRAVYPQGPRLRPNEPLLGAIMYVEVHKGFFTQDPELRDVFDLTKTVDFSEESGKPNDIRDIFEIRIFNGGGNNPVIYSANPASDIRNGGKAFPLLDRNGNEIKQAIESGPNTNIYELEFMVYCPDSTPLSQFLQQPICTDRLFDGLLQGVGVTVPPSFNPQQLFRLIEPLPLTFKANSPIEVIFNDPQDDSGTPEDVEAFAIIQGVTGQLPPSGQQVGYGEPMPLFFMDQDFNFDSRAAEFANFNFLRTETDKAPIEVPFGFGLIVMAALGTFSTSEPGFREIDLGALLSTGTFVPSTNSSVFGIVMDSGALTEEFASRGSKMELIYTDFTPSGGGNAPRLESDVFIKAIPPEIRFDKEEYTPFDEVKVTVISPDSNVDWLQIDTIRPLISTSSDSGFLIEMGEIALNSSVFEEDLDLTPDKSKFQGDLVAQREDGLTVEFRIDSKTVVTKSVFINYHVGHVRFDKGASGINDRAIVSVIDPDENRNPDTIDTVDVRLWSSTDRGGLAVTLRETGDRTGIFEEFLTFTPNEESSGTRLRVSEGDTITAKYTDRTLPPPAALDVDGVFTVEIEELFASALIGSALPLIERALVTEPQLVDQNGMQVDEVKVGAQLLIQSQIANNQDRKEEFVYIVQVKDSAGATDSLSWITGELADKDSIMAAQSWIPERAGGYEIEVFVWESMQYGVRLSPARSMSVTVS